MAMRHVRIPPQEIDNPASGTVSRVRRSRTEGYGGLCRLTGQMATTQLGLDLKRSNNPAGTESMLGALKLENAERISFRIMKNV